jgi:hypothetical protein
MTPEQLLNIIQMAIGIFVVVIIVLLIIPKSRKWLSEMQPEPNRKQRSLDFTYGINFILLPFYWLIRVIIALFK